MAFNPNKYAINRRYINKGNARSGAKMSKVRFAVAHDIGNGGSTADNNQRYFNNHQPSASAHTFIDDKEILEIVPLDEKAWHVRYDVTGDNVKFGDDANDCAVGTELCWGPKINFQQAYEKYVWYHAYLCYKFGLDPKTEIVAHATLDPARRSDPHNAFGKNGKTYAQFIADVVRELQGSAPAPKPTTPGANEVPNNVSQLKVKVDNLHTYKTPNWNDKTGPIVNKNEVYTIKRKLVVNGSPMYQLISGWYITASDKYVEPYKPSAPTPAPAPKPAPKPVKEYAYFPPGHGTWSVYPLTKAPIKANAVGAINPSKFGGLEYEVLGHPYPNVVTIQTGNFGRVNIFVGDSNSKVYKK
jgi:N-acetylmuramoyl-L-alanine amidase